MHAFDVLVDASRRSHARTSSDSGTNLTLYFFGDKDGFKRLKKCSPLTFR